MSFTITLLCVFTMLCYAVPGFLLIKSKKISPDSIPAFANVLMYFCSPCLTIYSFTQADFSMQILKDSLVLLGTSVALQIALLGFFYVLYRKKQEDVRYRIANIATALGNCAFMGVPLLEATMPDYPEAIIMSVVFCVGMNLIGWTIASTIITNDRKYMRVQNALLNPATLALIVALPMFVTGYQMPSQIENMFTVAGRMSTPLCMLIMGMRLATIEFRKMFSDGLIYFSIAVKQILMPIMGLALISIFPVSADLKRTMFILCATPVASVVLNFSEMLGQGQKNAANTVLLGTLLSIVTIPLMMLLI